MRLEGSAVYLESQRRFHQLVTGLDVISELYGDGEATLVYDLHTATPAGTQRTAELFRPDAGRIASILIVFDASPWRPIMGALTEDGPDLA